MFSYHSNRSKTFRCPQTYCKYPLNLSTRHATQDFAYTTVIHSFCSFAHRRFSFNINNFIILHPLVQPFGIWLLRIISPLSRTGKYRGKQLSRPLSEYSDLETAFLFYFHAIFSARKGIDCKIIYYPLSLTVAR